MSKRDFGTTKCLLHFDFPYFNEPNDGLDDDVGIETWSKENTNVKLYGSQIPKAGTKAPRFGYRCLYPYKSAAMSTNTSGIWNMNSSGDYEIEFFVYPKAHGAEAEIRRLFRLWPSTVAGTASIFMLSLTTDGKLEFTSTGWGIKESITGTRILIANTWHHVLIRIMGQTLKVFLDGTEDISVDLPEDITLTVAQGRIGNFANENYALFIDEFVFRYSAGTDAPTVPTHPYSGQLILDTVGGYKGVGSLSDGTCR